MIRRSIVAAADWYANTIKKPTLNQNWSLNLPGAILVIYLGTTYGYHYIEDVYPNIIYVGPQTYFFLCILYLRFIRRITFKDMGVSLYNIRQNILFALVLVVLPYLGAFVLGGTLYGIDQIHPIVGGHLAFFANKHLDIDPVFAFCLVVYAPICEEIIFRGILLPPLIKDFGFKTAIVFNALIFMTAHLKFHPGAFVLGICAAVIYATTHSLIPVVFFHAACNAAGLLIPKFFPFIFQFIRFLFQ